MWDITARGLVRSWGAQTRSPNSLYLAYDSTSSGVYNLNGGKLILKSLVAGSGTAAFNFGGGTMQASGSFTTTVPMTLTGAGGDATVDTAGYAVTFSSPLSGPGGLNKIGDNTLTLSAANAYAGNTTVSAGTLLLSTIGSLLADVNDGHNSLFSVAPGARLDLYGALKLDLDDVSAFSGSWALVDSAGTTVYEPSFLLETIHGAPFLGTDDVWTYTAGPRQWTFTETTGQLSLVSVPEPNTWLLLLSTLPVLLLLRRRRR